MKFDAFIRVIILSAAGAVLCLVLIALSGANQRLQNQIQVRQQALNAGILGQQGQQITGGVLQDLMNAAQTNPQIKTLLEQYGYAVPMPAPASTGAVPETAAAPAQVATVPVAVQTNTPSAIPQTPLEVKP